jgi:transposase InsO family protein
MRSNRSRRKRIIASRGFAAAGGGARYLRLRPRRPKASDPEATRSIDLVDRQFYTDGPDRLWVADINRSPVMNELIRGQVKKPRASTAFGGRLRLPGNMDEDEVR